MVVYDAVRRLLRELALAVCVACAAAGAVGASAAQAAARPGHPKYLAPPGNSALSQYLEVVPSAGGAAPPRTGAKPTVLSAGQRRRLDQLGAPGRTLESVVAATSIPLPVASSGRAPRGHGKRRGRSGASPGRGSGAGSTIASGIDGAPPVSGRSPVGEVLSAATGHEVGGGLGILLPALVLGAIVIVLIAVVRRRGLRGA